MARKFVDLEEAATMLGITPDTLNEMRERREVFGYRDGGAWKFKAEDIERLAADRAASVEEGEYAELDEDPDSILLSEVELGQSDESTSSTIIGGRASLKDPADNDIQIAQPKHDSDVNLDSALASGSEGGSDVLQAGSGVSPMFDELDTLDLEMPSAADSGIASNVFTDAPSGSGGGSKAGSGTGSQAGSGAGSKAGTSDVMLGSDALSLEGSSLAFGSEEELALGEASGLELSDSKGGGSDIDLTGDLDDDLVLGGSSHSDLSRSGDSGISLLDPADSGLSLESAPLELGGSAVESLELGEDDMLLSDEPTPKSGPKAAPVAAQQESEDDFLLTPLEEAGIEESDSGSQVIALDSEVEFESAAMSGVSGAGLESQSDLGGLLEEDLGEGLGAAPAPIAGRAAVAGRMTAAGSVGAGVLQAPEPAYSGWNVASLVMCGLLLMLSGMFMYDLMRNMWSWSGPYSVNSSMMDMVMSWFEK